MSDTQPPKKGLNFWFDRIERAWDTAFDDPNKLAHHIATLICFISSIVTIWYWTEGYTFRDLQVPLLFVGISVIVMLVISTREGTQGFAVTLAVLIVGTTVTGPEFLLKIMQNWGTTQQQQGYGQPPSRGPAGESDVMAPDPAAEAAREEELIRRALERFQKDTNPVAADRVAATISSELSQSRINDAVGAVRARGADFPLRRVAMGGVRWRTFVDDYETDSFFIEDMNFLEGRGLVTFSGQDLRSAELTDLGRAVLAQLENGDVASVEGVFVAQDIPAAASLRGPNDPRLLPVNVGISEDRFAYTDEASVFLRFSLPAATDLKIETATDGFDEGALVDTVLVVTRLDSMAVVAEDDDSRPPLDSLIHANFVAGDYAVEVKNLFLKTGAFDLSISAEPVPAEGGD